MDEISIRNVCMNCMKQFNSVYNYRECPDCSGKMTHVLIRGEIYRHLVNLSRAFRTGTLKTLKLNIKVDGTIIASFIPRRSLYRIFRIGDKIYVQFKGGGDTTKA